MSFDLTQYVVKNNFKNVLVNCLILNKTLNLYGLIHNN